MREAIAKSGLKRRGFSALACFDFGLRGGLRITAGQHNSAGGVNIGKIKIDNGFGILW